MLAWFLFAALFAPLLRGGTADKPNVVLILTDDQGYGDLSSYGHPAIETPNIDRLGEEGLRLTDFYAGQNICTPARAALLTGCYAKRVSLHRGVLFPHHKKGLNPEETTIADLLKANGYATGMFGKWHLGSREGLFPTDNGFDEWLGPPYSNDMGRKRLIPNTKIKVLDRGWEAIMESSDWFNVPLMRATAGEEAIEVQRPMNQVTLTDRLTDSAIYFMQRHRDQPFFVFLAHPQPHIPLFVSEKHYEPDVEKAYQLAVEHLDASTGRILDALQALGVAENTIVIYTSDNGPWVGKSHHGGSAGEFRSGKMHTFEGGHRVPFLMRWPARLPPGEVFEGLMTAMDVLPTLAAATGSPMPEKEIDGYNMLPTLAGDAPNPRTSYLYYSYVGNLDGICRGDWKLHRNSGRNPIPGKKIKLYNLREDPGETIDVSSQHPELVEELFEQMRAENLQIKKSRRKPGRVK